MSAGREWSDEERQKHEQNLETLLDSDARQFHEGHLPEDGHPGANGSISAEECREMRDLADGASSTRVVSEEMSWSNWAIRQHVTGACRHDHEIVGRPLAHSHPTDAPHRGQYERVGSSEVSD